MEHVKRFAMLMINWNDKNRNGLEIKPAYATRHFILRKMIYRSPLYVKEFLRHKGKYEHAGNGTLKTLWIFPYISRMV